MDEDTMRMVDFTFRCFISDEQHEHMRELQTEGEFGTPEAVELIERAHDSSLIKVDNEAA